MTTASGHPLTGASAQYSQAFLRLCDNYAKDLILYLAGLLQTSVTCEVNAIRFGHGDDPDSSEKVFHAPIVLENCAAFGCLEIPHPLGNGIVQVLLGAPADSDLSHPCAWTDLEMTLLQEFLSGIVDHCSQGWVRNGGVPHSLAGTIEEGSPHSAGGRESQDLARVDFAISAGGINGSITLAIPTYVATSGGAPSTRAQEPPSLSPPASALSVLRIIGRASVRLDATMPGPMISADELAALRPGCAIQFERPAQLPVSVNVAGRDILWGTLEPSPGGRRMVRIQHEVEL